MLAIGPETPGWGSWNSVGADLGGALSRWYRTVTFDSNGPRQCDVALVVKHPLPREWWQSASPRPPVIYCPIDSFGSAGEIDQNGDWLRLCSRIVIHCERLWKYFSLYSATRYIDHHIKFAGPPQAEYHAEGPILWVGVRTNLPPLVDWVNSHDLPRELVLLTNPEDPTAPLDPTQYGFHRDKKVNMECWSEERHLAWLGRAAAAIDIKGDDFRQRHKAPAKALDFLAAGVPLAMNRDSSSVEHLAKLGFDVADPNDRDRWLSHEYWDETNRFGRAMRELLSRDRIAWRFRRLIDDVLLERADPAAVRERPFASGGSSAEARSGNIARDAVGAPPDIPRKTRVAILSLLFNWPSTGGGTVHTAEAGKFLGHSWRRQLADTATFCVWRRWSACAR
jgi:hypothetical protein